nr:MAG TPA: hypothetical protein [Caudoviricetes sp.]
MDTYWYLNILFNNTCFHYCKIKFRLTLHYNHNI